MHPDVITVAVSPARVIDRQCVCAFLDKDGGETPGRLGYSRFAKRTRRWTDGVGEARVSITQQDGSMYSEGPRRAVQLRQPPLSESLCVGSEATLAGGRDDKYYSVPLCHNPCQGSPGEQSLIVRMSVESHQRVRRTGGLSRCPATRLPSIHNESFRLRQVLMRILHVTDVYLPRLGGIEMHVSDLASAQRAEGHEVDVLTLTAASLATPVGSVVGPHVNAGLWSKATFVWRHRAYAAERNYDVVHVHCSTVSPLGFAVLARTRIPTLVTVHSLWRRYTILYRAADYGLRWSKLPVGWSAVSESAAQSVRRAAAAKIDVAVLPNAVNLDAWRVARPAREPDEVRMISVMRLASRKRPMPLLKTLRAVRDAAPPTTRVSAMIVGDGPQRGRVERYLRRHAMSEWVTMTGQLNRSEIAAALARSDVFVAPATLESFGIAALEARAAGLPVVGRCGTGLSDFVGDGATARW
jgi:glycosyltransferase involved in cell wall biosynthesis